MLSNLGAAPEAASVSESPQRVRREIKTRTTLCKDYTVLVYVPEDAALGCFPPEKPEIHFVRFPLPMAGGVINCFVHGRSPEQAQKYCGKTISAVCEVIVKTFTDDQSYLHIDFHPTKGRVQVKHQMVAINGRNHRMLPGARQFETPKPVNATIFITQFGKEFMTPSRMYLLHERRDKIFTHPGASASKTDEPARTPVEEKKEVPTTHRPLEELKAQGWEVAEENDREIILHASPNGMSRKLKIVRSNERDRSRHAKQDAGRSHKHHGKVQSVQDNREARSQEKQPQLGNLLKSGWKIDRDDGRTVELYRRGEDGKRHTMKFERQNSQRRHQPRSHQSHDRT